jgi:hypothetical protein
MLIHNAYPQTLDQVQSSIQDWMGKPERVCPLHITWAEQSSRLRCQFSHASADFKVEINGQCLLMQCKQRRLNLNLDRFVLKMAHEAKGFWLDIERDPEPEHRSLNVALRQLEKTKYPAFYTRIIRALASLESDLSDSSIDEATAAPTDHLVMLEAVSSAPWVAELVADDPLLAAKLRGVELRRQMLKSAGGTLTAERVAEHLGISRQAVDKRRSSNSLLALTQGKRGYSYPSFQFQEGKTLPGLEEVLGDLSSLDPWMQLNFFTSPNERLDDKTPIKALQNGLTEEVKGVARVYGEQGAL